MFNIEKIRADFPILQQTIAGRPLVYLDNAATTQKPNCVMESLKHYYEFDNANVHRAVHTLSERATHDYELARDKVQKFIHAKSREEIIWTKGTTESINLVAQSYLRPHLMAGDEILITAMEHHANIVPWQLVAQQTGACLRVLPINDQGELIIDQLEQLVSEKTKLFAVAYIANSIGTINPIKQLIDFCHSKNVPVLVDAAQAAPHIRLDVEKLNCDFLVFSSHKCYGPTGIGVLYGKKHLLEAMPPYQGGGDMIHTVSFEQSTYAPLPLKFEAGTPNIADAIAFAAALDYLAALDWPSVMHYEHQLFLAAHQALTAIPELRIIGDAPASHHAAILSFVFDHLHPHDVATILNEYGVAVRAGHHCAMPLMQRFQVPATTRVSFSFYNTLAEIDVLVEAIWAAKKIFK
jgi:cysteine desulfurase/selenocysteine lyase